MEELLFSEAVRCPGEERHDNIVAATDNTNATVDVTSVHVPITHGDNRSHVERHLLTTCQQEVTGGAHTGNLLISLISHDEVALKAPSEGCGDTTAHRVAHKSR